MTAKLTRIEKRLQPDNEYYRLGPLAVNTERILADMRWLIAEVKRGHEAIELLEVIVEDYETNDIESLHWYIDKAKNFLKSS